ncbi:MAG: Uma2 family endonuclease [Tepidisphaerales bacterium]
MSSVAVQVPPDPSPEPIFRLSVQKYHAMVDAGVLADDDPVELLEGILVFKMPKKPTHPLAVRLLTTAIDAVLPPEWHFRAQEPITLDDGEPEPDGAVVAGQPRQYAGRHPGPADVALVIEVADTTLDRDRGIKLRSYARAGIHTYWIVNLPDQCIEVYTRPESSADNPRYDSREVLAKGKVVDLVLGGRPVAGILVSDVLP